MSTIWGNQAAIANNSTTILSTNVLMRGIFPAVSNAALQTVTIESQMPAGTVRVAVYTGGTSDNDPTGAVLLEDLGTFSIANTRAFRTATSATNPIIPASTRIWIVFRQGTSHVIQRGSGNGELLSGSVGYVSAVWTGNTDTAFSATVPSGPNAPFITNVFIVGLTYTVANNPVATTLVFGTQPQDSIVDQTMATWTVEARDAANVVVTGYTDAMSIADNNDDYFGTESVNAVAGVGTFNAVRTRKLGESVALTVIAEGLSSAVSASFDITAPIVGGGNTIITGGGMYTDAVIGGATSISIELEATSLVDGSPVTNLSFNTAGLVIAAWRGANGAVDPITLVTQTSTGAWVSGGFAHKTNGKYRLDVPNSLLAAGVPFTRIEASGVANVKFSGARIDIAGSNPRDASLTPGALRDDAITFAANIINGATTLTVKNSTNADVVIPVTRVARLAIATTSPPV